MRQVYNFEELLSPQATAPPPLIFIHIPKTAGSTLNNVLMKNYKFRADSRGSKFIPRYTVDEIQSLGSSAPSTDDRIRPAFFTGHINLDNEIFGLMPGRYVAIAILRDPIERIISHYRFNSTTPSAFQEAILGEKLNVIGYWHKFASMIPMQHRVFAPNGNVDAALDRLEKEVSWFGVQSEFDRFLAMLAALLGVPTISYKILNRTPNDAIGVTAAERAELRSLLAPDIEFFEKATDIYRERLERMPQRAATHPWQDYYS